MLVLCNITKGSYLKFPVNCGFISLKDGLDLFSFSLIMFPFFFSVARYRRDHTRPKCRILGGVFIAQTW